MENIEKKPLDKAIEDYLGQQIPTSQECNTEECKIKQDKSILERINKKIITEDGRQLLF